MKNQFGVSEVNAVMSERGITRKSAVRFLSRQPARKIAFSTAAVAPAKNFKRAAAHDVEKPSDAGAARAEGMRLYKLAGRPNKDQIVAAYGTPKAYGWTWAQRAKSVSLATAEEAALKFQELLAAK
jgi:hypothetical protein